MRACQCASRLAPRTALLGGVALWLLLLGSPANAGSCFPNDCYVQASVGDQNTPNLQITSGTTARVANGPDEVTGQGSTFLGNGTGSAVAIADYGPLKAMANVLTTTIFANNLAMEISGYAAFQDVWLVTSPTLPVRTPVTVTLTALLSANILVSGGQAFDSSGTTNATLDVRLGSNIFCGICPPDILIRDTLDVGPFLESETLMIPTEVGGSIVALAELNVQAINIPPIFVVGGTGATLVDASKSGDIFLDPPPGVVLISGSGHDYATLAQSCGVPGAPPCSASEPSSFLLLGSGVAGLAGVTWRRHRHK
jgi:hypothetical protein